jgi:hypothetical protein
LEIRESKLRGEWRKLHNINFIILYIKKSKGKVAPLQAQLWSRGGRGIALLFQDLGATRG